MEPLKSQLNLDLKIIHESIGALKLIEPVRRDVSLRSRSISPRYFPSAQFHPFGRTFWVIYGLILLF